MNGVVEVEEVPKEAEKSEEEGKVDEGAFLT